nr:hypothetical protein [uncultured Blautia sp.]
MKLARSPEKKIGGAFMSGGLTKKYSVGRQSRLCSLQRNTKHHQQNRKRTFFSVSYIIILSFLSLTEGV